jgi:group I intron endonuclease
MFTSKYTNEQLRHASGIYKLTLRGTPRCYVGQARLLLKRLRGHISHANWIDNPAKCVIDRAIFKYGVEAFDLEILCFCEIGLLDEMEMKFIKDFRCVEIGFNIREKAWSGDTYRATLAEETKEKIRQANTGKKRSPETLERMRQSALRKPPMSEAQKIKARALRHTDEAKARMSAAHKGRKIPPDELARRIAAQTGLKRSPEAKARQKAAARLKRGKPVSQFDLQGNFIKTYSSTAEASEAIGTGRNGSGNIVNAAKGKLKTNKGFIWRYAEIGSS